MGMRLGVGMGPFYASVGGGRGRGGAGLLTVFVQMMVWMVMLCYWMCWAMLYWPVRTAVRAYRKRHPVV